MQSMLAVELAILVELQALLQSLLVLAREVIDPLALSAFELDHLFLGHIAIFVSRQNKKLPGG
jgi:hypothetical protein